MSHLPWFTQSLKPYWNTVEDLDEVKEQADKLQKEITEMKADLVIEREETFKNEETLKG